MTALIAILSCSHKQALDHAMPVDTSGAVKAQPSAAVHENKPHSIAKKEQNPMITSSENRIPIKHALIKTVKQKDVSAKAETIKPGVAEVSTQRVASSPCDTLMATTKQVGRCAYSLWKEALEDTNWSAALVKVTEAIRLYENGSLFTLKACLLYTLQKYNESAQNAETSLARTDHWDKADRKLAMRVLAKAYNKQFSIHPSRLLRNKAKMMSDRFYSNYGEMP